MNGNNKPKVVDGGEILFAGDIIINDKFISENLDVPKPYLFNIDELVIIYKGHIYTLSKNAPKPGDDYLKIYTKIFSIEEKETARDMENRYFAENEDIIKKLKEEFIAKIIDTEILEETKSEFFCKTIRDDISGKIYDVYEPIIQGKKSKNPVKSKNTVKPQNDDSIFNKWITEERALILDGRIYDLVTIAEHISKCASSFDKEFYMELIDFSYKNSPQDISEKILSNTDKINKDAIHLVRDKIWHSERSSIILIDGAYFIAEYREKTGDLIKEYSAHIERKIKIDAINEAFSTERR